jgi:starch phosphorylase
MAAAAGGNCSMSFSFTHPYPIAPEYSRRVAYFCMEYAIHQPLKLYAGGLGFLAGSHLRSAFELGQNLTAVGILWKYGYYDQVRKSDQTMDVLFEEKVYGFLEPTDIRFTITISGHEVWVTAFYLPPAVFGTAPLFLLTTDLPENDYLARTISHKLYDAHPETKIAAAILLGVGGAKLFEVLRWEPETWHLNESHGLPLAFYLYRKWKDLAALRQRLVFTNHTPEDGGNPRNELSLLEKMGFFCGLAMSEVPALTGARDNELNHTLAALRLAGLANGVSKLHLQTLNTMWKDHRGICPMISITNAQNATYWAAREMYEALNRHDIQGLAQKKRKGKQQLFEVVADQNGEIYDTGVLTLVFAKRFTGYKRADLLLEDHERFHRLVTNKQRPIQLIWAGKPYPMDYTSIGDFDNLVHICKGYPNCSVLVGYELRLSKLLKYGADIWLNLPRMTHEASGTSGMTAAMNGALNIGIPDGWFPEFANDKVNSFVIPSGDPTLPDHQQDFADAASLYNLLENTVIPLYYDDPARWYAMVGAGMRDILPHFDSNRLAAEYYARLYLPAAGT